MATTTNLGLPLVTTAERSTKDWADFQKEINDEASGTSAMKKIDDFAGTVKRTVRSIEIAVVDWADNTCTKACSGATATNFIQVSPDPSDFLAYGTAQIRATEQGTDTLTFVCTTTPTEAITVNVLIVG